MSPRLVGAALLGSVALAGASLTLRLLPAALYPEAVCLDGSPAGYYWKAPSGGAAGSFILHFEGGGWCHNGADCRARANTTIGSSKAWKPTATLAGFMSESPATNPDFADYGMVYLNYCDGASFSGDAVFVDGGMTLYSRGHAILNAILNDLLGVNATGDGRALPALDASSVAPPTGLLANASDVVITGCSAGGLSTYLHADYVAGVLRRALPSSLGRVVAMADAGFFINSPTMFGEPFQTTLYQNEVALHGVAQRPEQASGALVQGTT
jgi:hypothetical protein